MSDIEWIDWAIEIDWAIYEGNKADGVDMTTLNITLKKIDDLLDERLKL